MSNRLMITVLKFAPLDGDEPSYGFTACDDYASAYDNNYESPEELFKAFPTENDLIGHVTQLNGFDDIDLDDDLIRPVIEVYGY